MASPDHSREAPDKPDHGCNGSAPNPDEQNGNDHCGCHHEETDPRLVTWSLAISGVLVGTGLLLRWLQVGPAALSLGIFVAAIIVGGWMLLPGAWAAVRQLRPNISSLMVIAVVGASVVGEWAEAATVVFLFGIAEWLEGWADRRARRATEALLELAPKIALVKRDGAFLEVPVDQVAFGEIIATKSGMSIPLDGVVIVGESAVNQAPITGESVPVDKKPGDTVFAGTINGEGSLEVRVTKAAGDTTLARIIRLVAEAQEQKAPTQRFVDVFARYYTPAVTVVALLIFLVPPLFMGGEWSVWLYRACVLLIIACPCALVISTPVSIVAGLTALARRGVLVKGGAHLETIGRLKALAVDKTGTITEGKPKVQGVELINARSEADVLRIAAAIDDHSAHPLAKAVVAYARSAASRSRGRKATRTAVVAGRKAWLRVIPILSAITGSPTNSACATKPSNAASRTSRERVSRSSWLGTVRTMAARARCSGSSRLAIRFAPMPRRRLPSFTQRASPKS